jgi:hypothetical protein
VEQLERVDLSMSEDNMKLAFWINVYNSLIMHVMPDIAQSLCFVFFNDFTALIFIHLQAYLGYGIPSSSLKRMALFHKVEQCTIYLIGVQYANMLHLVLRIFLFGGKYVHF